MAQGTGRACVRALHLHPFIPSFNQLLLSFHFWIDTLCSELDQERKARYAIQQKLKGNIYPPPKKTKTKHNQHTPQIQICKCYFLNVGRVRVNRPALVPPPAHSALGQRCSRQRCRADAHSCVAFSAAWPRFIPDLCGATVLLLLFLAISRNPARIIVSHEPPLFVAVPRFHCAHLTCFKISDLVSENRVCVCARTFSLMDPLLPRSSRRPSPFLLQDAHPSPVRRSLRLQTPAAASVAAQHRAASEPAPHSQKYTRARPHTPVHISMESS